MSGPDGKYKNKVNSIKSNLKSRKLNENIRFEKYSQLEILKKDFHVFIDFNKKKSSDWVQQETANIGNLLLEIFTDNQQHER